MTRMPSRPRRDGFPARLIQDMAAVAGVAVGHEAARPVATAPTLRRRTLTPFRLLPRTVRLCVHCRQSPAGFWVSRRGDQTVRRPWCLGCCQELPRDQCDLIPFER